MRKTLLAILLATATMSHAEPTASQSTLKVYAAPDQNAKVIVQLDPSKGITILPTNWVQVKDMNTNTTGWVTQDELNKALHQDNVWVKKISGTPNMNYQTVSEIRTGKSANEEYKQIIKEVKEQRQHMNDNFYKAMQQIKNIEESIFESSTQPTTKTTEEKPNSYWSSFLQTKVKN